jgi:hypothetical protein
MQYLVDTDVWLRLFEQGSVAGQLIRSAASCPLIGWTVKNERQMVQDIAA